MQQAPQLTLEEQLQQVQYSIREIRATQDILVNYIQILIEERGLKEKAAHLEKQIEELRTNG